MSYKFSSSQLQPHIALVLWTLVLLCTGCSGLAGPIPLPATPTSTASPSVPTDRPTPTLAPPAPTATATLQATATLTPTLTSTPAPLTTFQTKLQPSVAAQAYLPDPCQVLSLRWDPANSAPGTIVVPVMIHSIAKNDRPITDDTTITEEYFFRFMERAHQLGFQTITSAQLVDFLQKNAKIPERALMLIVDDRKRSDFFTTLFFPYLKKYSWTVTNAWIAHPDTPAYLWKENESLVPGGLVDFQAHGVIHNTPIEEGLPEEYVRNEIFGPLQPIEQHFGKRPIAFIWPRGLFTAHAVDLARQAGYQVGFTVYARGPVLFNWIPQGAEERKVQDPLMVLPRYWDTTAIAALDEAAQVAQAAKAFYAQQRPAEMKYLQQYCPQASKLQP